MSTHLVIVGKQTGQYIVGRDDMSAVVTLRQTCTKVPPQDKTACEGWLILR